MRFELHTQASPQQVLEALTDFSERRLAIWDRTLDPKTYEVRELGDTWAVARESTPRSPFWVVERYDWSEPGVVRWTDVETSWGGLGGGSVRVTAEGDGSRVEVQWTNGTAGGLRVKAMLAVLHHWPMDRMIARMWRGALDRYARAA